MGGSEVERHYARDGLTHAIRAALAKAGKDPARATLEDLAPVDEFHLRGRRATVELAERVRPVAGDRVLDIGCGLGGPSRHLAATFGCHVSGIDLTFAYCRTAAELAGWVGLNHRVAYAQAEALALPFAAASFDLAWTQHAAMNIAAKARLYGEVHRVLKPGRTLALYDIVQGEGGPPLFPMPWASGPALSHLLTPDALRHHLQGAGFAITSWRDLSEAGHLAATALAERLRTNAPPPLLTLTLGPEAATIARNLERNLTERRIGLIEATARRG